MHLNQDKPKFLALAFPYIEKQLNVPLGFHHQVGLCPGSINLMEPFFQEQLISQAPCAPYFNVGGGVTGLMHELSQRGERGELVGKVGRDTAGNFFRNFLERADLNLHLAQSLDSTSQLLSLTDPSGVKTSCYSIGASLDLDVEDLDWGLFEGIDGLILDANSLLWGYLPFKAIELAKKEGARVYFFLEAIFDLVPYKEILIDLLSNQVDYWVAQRPKAKKLLGERLISQLENQALLYDSSDKVIHKMPKRDEESSIWLLSLLDFLKKEHPHKNQETSLGSRAE